MNDPVPARLSVGGAPLPCGADADLLLEQAAQGRGGAWDAHQRGCVHCQASLGAFTSVWSPVADLAATPVTVPPGLAAAVMTQVRGLAAVLAEKATAGHRHPHAAVGVLGRAAVVDLAVAIGYDDPAQQVAREIDVDGGDRG